jgi:hypothetical protein
MAFGLWDDVGVITAHHSNKLGMVSGDWARHADTVIHLEKDHKNPATKFTLEKARPANPDELGVPFLLEWLSEEMGYRRRSLSLGEKLPDQELVARVFEVLEASPGMTMRELEAAVGGNRERVRGVAKRALSEGKLVNGASRAGWYRLVLASAAGESGEESEQTRLDTDVDSRPGDSGDIGDYSPSQQGVDSTTHSPAHRPPVRGEGARRVECVVEDNARGTVHDDDAFAFDDEDDF